MQLSKKILIKNLPGAEGKLFGPVTAKICSVPEKDNENKFRNKHFE